jgi:hypothetical protein
MSSTKSSVKNTLNILSCVLNDACRDCLLGPGNRLKILCLESNAAKLLLMTLLTILLVIYILKVYKNDNFFGFDFEFCTISMLVMHKKLDFSGKKFLLDHYGGAMIIPRSLKTTRNE